MKTLDFANLSDLFSSENNFNVITEMISDLGLELVNVSVEE